jgi:CheY-like chemotaxis protein
MVILVVEDDRLINLMASDELQAEGYDVISAYNADEAIEILENRTDVNFVFTDIDMDGSMDGLKLASFVRDRWPPIEIIVTSGKRVPRALPERVVFVPKPYRAEHVLQTIASFAGF